MENDLVLRQGQMYKSRSDKFSTSTLNPIQKIEQPVYSNPSTYSYLCTLHCMSERYIGEMHQCAFRCESFYQYSVISCYIAVSAFNIH